MIITKTPFRVSFIGGGSDLPSFYKHYGGCVINTSIRKYMYISVHPYFYNDTTVLKYSKTEIVKDLNNINHPIFKQVLQDFNLRGLEVTSTADIPSGTGLGSSSAFTVGLLNALYCYSGKYVSKQRIAEEACNVEICKLGSPIGKQDQYAASLGGLNYIAFHQDGRVSIEPIVMKDITYKRLEKNLLMFYTGDIRSANRILSEQSKNMKENKKVDSLKRMCSLTNEMKHALENNDLTNFGEIMNESWKLKRTLASGITNVDIDQYYETAIKNGAAGGKLLGAGGGGFLLFYCEEEKQDRLRQALELKEMDFSFDHDGTTVIFIGDKYWH